MRIRPYIESRDYTYIEKWVGDEKNHALCFSNKSLYGGFDSVLCIPHAFRSANNSSKSV